MKRKTLAIALIIVIALSIASWLVYDRISGLQTQISELQEQLDDLKNQIESVKITEFEWESGFYPFAGVTLVNTVKITVQNKGANNMSGLTLAVKMVYNDTELEGGFTEQIDTLHAGERLESSDLVYSQLDGRPDGTKCVSTLMWGKLVLDERTEAIVWN